jgi:hypothetical protein
MDEWLVDASDALYADRMRTLLAVDDVVAAVFDALRGAGVLGDTYVLFTSDHGYHNGQYALWAEKSQIYDTDTRIPFVVVGPGVLANATDARALVSPLDVGATLLELGGAVPPGNRTTDGRSFAALLRGSPGGPWRDRLLIEFPGYPTQYLGPCGYYEDLPGVACPPPAGEPQQLIDAPSNSYSALRIVNATHDVLYAEYRPGGSPITRSSTNFTEAYDYAADAWALVNKAAPGGGPHAWPPALLAQLSDELWAVATCAGEACP